MAMTFFKQNYPAKIQTSQDKKSNIAESTDSPDSSESPESLDSPDSPD